MTNHSGTEVCAWDGGQLMECTATDAGGNYALTLPEGTCDVTVEKARYLDSEKTGVLLSSGTTETLPSLMLRGGDANDDDVINILDLSLMGGHFGLSCGDPGWDDRADINGDCTVNILDITVAGGNFLNTSPLPWP